MDDVRQHKYIPDSILSCLRHLRKKRGSLLSPAASLKGWTLTSQNAMKLQVHKLDGKEKKTTTWVRCRSI